MFAQLELEKFVQVAGCGGRVRFGVDGLRYDTIRLPHNLSLVIFDWIIE